MSAVETKPVTETPAAPAVESTPAATEAPTLDAPKLEESKPTAELPAGIASEETAAAPAAEVATPAEPKESGHLTYTAPGNFFKELISPPKKAFFWFGEGPVESKDLKTYLAKAKDAGHSTAAWASQTGKGLLFFNKHSEDKAAPSGALNLADVEDIKENGPSHFTLLLHGHKHKFDAHTAAERDAWVASVKAVAEEAKTKKDQIVGSDGYKESLASLKPAPIAAVAAPKASDETPKKSEETPAELEENKKTAKSRSRSRGAPIIGLFKSKKEAHKEKSEVEDKKEETPTVTEPAAVAEPVAETPVEPTPAETTETAAVLPLTEEAPKEESPKEAKKDRRVSRFESFLRGKPKKEETASAAAPVEEPSHPEQPIPSEAPVIAEPVAEESILPLTEAPKEETAKEDIKEEEKATAPTKERKPSFLTGIKSFTQKVRSPSSEHPPAAASEPIKTEETPAVVEPIEPTSEAPVATEAAAVPEEETTAATNGETKTEKRRSSFFNFGALNKKKTEAAPATEEASAPKIEEPTEEAVKPAEEAPEVPKKSTEEKVETPTKETKEANPIASLGRRFSKAIRGDKAKKETKTPSKVEETEPTAELPTEPIAESKPTDTTIPTGTTESTPAKLTAPTGPSIGDVVPEAVTVGHAPVSSPTVSATA